jgi:hypothetical protein
MSLSRDQLLLEVDATFTLEDGTKKEGAIPITVGDVEDYLARPPEERCRCEYCQHHFAHLGVKLYRWQKELLAGTLTEKQFVKRMRRLGSGPVEKITHQ